MTMARATLGCAAVGLVLACTAAAPSAVGEAAVLVFSKTVAYRHASIEAGIESLRERAGAAGLVLHATEDAGEFSSENLSDYGAVVFLSTTGDVLNDEEQEALEDFVRGGGGFVGIHSASDTEYDWPWYGRLVGAYFDGHPPGVRTGTLHVVDPAHAATSTLPSPWTRVDEWYDLRDLQTGLSVLLEIDETSYKTAGESPSADPRPIAWYREFEGGRTFYTALGHTTESYTDPLFLSHVWGGITWALGR